MSDHRKARKEKPGEYLCPVHLEAVTDQESQLYMAFVTMDGQPGKLPLCSLDMGAMANFPGLQEVYEEMLNKMVAVIIKEITGAVVTRVEMKHDYRPPSTN